MSGRTYAAALAAVDWIEEEESRAEIANAGVIAYEGASWLVKTDGKIGLAMRLADGEEAHGKPHRVADQLAGLLDAPFAAIEWATTVEAFREAVGEPAPHTLCAMCHGLGGKDCERCDGDGLIECECSCGDQHERDCPDCDGTGGDRCEACGDRKREYPEGPAPSRVLIRTPQQTSCFNRRLLSPLLAHVAGPITWIQMGETSVARLRGDDWIGIVMPMRNWLHELADAQVDMQEIAAVSHA